MRHTITHLTITILCIMIIGCPMSKDKPPSEPTGSKKVTVIVITVLDLDKLAETKISVQLSAIEEIQSVKANIKDKEVKITLNKEIPTSRIMAAISRAGYTPIRASKGPLELGQME